MAASVAEISDAFARASMMMAEAETKVITTEELRDSYKKAIDTHIHRADRLLVLAAKLNASSSARRRTLAAPAVNHARKRVTAAETCDVLLCGIDPDEGERRSHLPWVGDSLGELNTPSLKEKIDIILTFLNVTAWSAPKRPPPDMDDGIPF